jgi:hypothetical protein
MVEMASNKINIKLYFCIFIIVFSLYIFVSTPNFFFIFILMEGRDKSERGVSES